MTDTRVSDDETIVRDDETIEYEINILVNIMSILIEYVVAYSLNYTRNDYVILHKFLFKLGNKELVQKSIDLCMYPKYIENDNRKHTLLDTYLEYGHFDTNFINDIIS